MAPYDLTRRGTIGFGLIRFVECRIKSGVSYSQWNA
jgi:hypothetical protein